MPTAMIVRSVTTVHLTVLTGPIDWQLEYQALRRQLLARLRHGHGAVDLRVQAHVVEGTGEDRHRDRAALSTAAGRPAVIAALPGTTVRVCYLPGWRWPVSAARS